MTPSALWVTLIGMRSPAHTDRCDEPPMLYFDRTSYAAADPIGRANGSQPPEECSRILLSTSARRFGGQSPPRVFLLLGAVASRAGNNAQQQATVRGRKPPPPRLASKPAERCLRAAVVKGAWHGRRRHGISL